jgi:hypothetical protein
MPTRSGKLLKLLTSTSQKISRVGWQLDQLTTCLSVAKAATHYASYVNWTHELRYIDKVQDSHIFNTPYFRKWMQEELQLSIAASAIACLSVIRREIDVRCRTPVRCDSLGTSYMFRRIWPGLPCRFAIRNRCMTWACVPGSGTIVLTRRQNGCVSICPVGSFFGMLAKFHEKQQESNRDRYNWSQDLNCHVHHFSDWNDTVSMLARILS